MTERNDTVNTSWTGYRLFLAGVFVFLGIFLGKVFFNAFYSMYALFVIAKLYGFEILNNATRNALLSGFTLGSFSFSWTSIISMFAVLALWAFFGKSMVFVTAQFSLPVTLPGDRKKAGERLSLFIWGGHGAAVFVKEGNLIERKRETDEEKETETKPGVALVDLSSAIVLSQKEDTQSWNLADNQDEDFDGLTGRMSVSRENNKRGKEKKKSAPFTEAKGPGLIFTEKGQEIFHVIDLRPQTRSKIVEAYTRDGIKLTSKVSVGFSLSDKPEALPVGFVKADGGAKELRWLDLEKSGDGQRITLKDSFELDEQDRLELLDYYNNRSDASFAPEESDAANAGAPYKFYPNRVFHAAYSKARSFSTGNFMPWYDAPLEIAVDIFRRELLSIPYDSLYNGLEFQQRDSESVKDQARRSVAAIKKLKDDFARRVKLKGIVHFQFYVMRRDESFQLGETADLRQVSRHPVIELSQNKFNSLRSMGIVVKSAGFGDLQPVNPEIKKKMIENWKAKWEKEIQFINAEYELEAVRVRNRNRAQIQQEMTYLLAGIFQNSHTDEALALRVFQALESAATNPTANNDLSPKEIVSMLESLHKWLLVERKGEINLPLPSPPLEANQSDG